MSVVSNISQRFWATSVGQQINRAIVYLGNTKVAVFLKSADNAYVASRIAQIVSAALTGAAMYQLAKSPALALKNATWNREDDTEIDKKAVAIALAKLGLVAVAGAAVLLTQFPLLSPALKAGYSALGAVGAGAADYVYGIMFPPRAPYVQADMGAFLDTLEEEIPKLEGKENNQAPEATTAAVASILMQLGALELAFSNPEQVFASQQALDDLKEQTRVRLQELSEKIEGEYTLAELGLQTVVDRLTAAMSARSAP